jgi:hypothetical protein
MKSPGTIETVKRNRGSRAFWVGLSMMAVSTCAAAVIYFTHPEDPDSEGVLVGIAAALWPFVCVPLLWLFCVALAIFDFRRSLVRGAVLGLLLATASWPTIFAGYELNQKPWLSASRKLQDPRARGAEMLGKSRSQTGIPLLVAALRDPDSQVRSAAATALGNYGPQAESAIPSLIAALDDEDWFVGCQAGEALGTMRGLQTRVLPPLVAHFSDNRDLYRRWCAVKAIGGLGPEAAPAVPKLMAQLKADDPNVRSAACETLGSIGPAAVDAIPTLTIALNDPNQWVRKAAKEALPKVQAASEKRGFGSME